MFCLTEPFFTLKEVKHCAGGTWLVSNLVGSLECEGNLASLSILAVLGVGGGANYQMDWD